MKTNPNEPINVMLGLKVKDLEIMQEAGILSGLTKREHFAGLAMQGLLNEKIETRSFDNLVQFSVIIADRLIRELNK
jgi:hypothetical protein